MTVADINLELQSSGAIEIYQRDEKEGFVELVSEQVSENNPVGLILRTCDEDAGPDAAVTVRMYKTNAENEETGIAFGADIKIYLTSKDAAALCSGLQFITRLTEG